MALDSAKTRPGAPRSTEPTPCVDTPVDRAVDTPVDMPVDTGLGGNFPALSAFGSKLVLELNFKSVLNFEFSENFFGP